MSRPLIIDSSVATTLVTMPAWLQYLNWVGATALIFLGCAVAVYRITIMREEKKQLQEKAKHE